MILVNKMTLWTFHREFSFMLHSDLIEMREYYDMY